MEAAILYCQVQHSHAGTAGFLAMLVKIPLWQSGSIVWYFVNGLPSTFMRKSIDLRIQWVVINLAISKVIKDSSLIFYGEYKFFFCSYF